MRLQSDRAMGGILAVGGARKSLVLFGVIAGHAVALSLLTALRPARKSPPAQLSSEIFFIEARRESSSAGQMQPAQIRMSDPSPPTFTVDGSIGESNAPFIDWDAERFRAAASAARYSPQIEAPAKRSANELPELGERGRVFREPLHRNGDSQHFDTGERVTWLDARNGRCHVTNLPASAPRLDERAVVVVCKHEREPARDDLVERAKPGYLRKPGEAATRREQR